MTDPPFVGSIARLVAARFRAPLLVVMQDVFPEIAVKLGRLRNPLVVGFLRMLIDPSLRAADRVVVIGETMKQRVAEKGVSPERIRVIPNWGDAASVVPQPHDNEWARRHKLAKSFVVMHSGQHRPRAEPRHAGPRVDVPARPRRPRGRPHRLRRAPRRARRARRATLEADKVEILGYQAAFDPLASRSRPPTSTSSGSPRAGRATSSRAASTGSSPPAGR